MTSAHVRPSVTQHRAQLVDALNRAIDRLVAASDVTDARATLETAMNDKTATDVAKDAENLHDKLSTILTLIKTADELDPHVLPEQELITDRKWGWGKRKKKPDELAAEALSQGEFRQRRFALQAAEANTNRRIAWFAIAAIFVNACATLGAALI